MNPAQHLLLFALRLYRWLVSPAITLLFGPACRFEPTCSVYAMGAVQRHGAVRGSWLAVKRVVRCQPWGGCGCDPVPDSPARPIASVEVGPERRMSNSSAAFAAH